MKEVIVMKVTTRRVETIHYHPDRVFHGPDRSLKEIATIDKEVLENREVIVDDFDLKFSTCEEEEVTVEQRINYVEHEEEDEWDD